MKKKTVAWLRPVKMKLFIMPILVFGTCFLFTSCTNRSQNKSNPSIKIGLAEVNYTPSVGLDLEGNYRGDDYASRGVHDSLYARAIVAEDENGNKAAVMTVDICYLPRNTVEFMRKYVASKTDIKAENILIAATHTHSGPPSALDAPQAKSYLMLWIGLPG
jgi:neutral ceramidase